MLSKDFLLAFVNRSTTNFKLYFGFLLLASKLENLLIRFNKAWIAVILELSMVDRYHFLNCLTIKSGSNMRSIYGHCTILFLMFFTQMRSLEFKYVFTKITR
jgi:hypothetical protein